jgi:bifunctional non-homologous end joining protein LigD
MPPAVELPPGEAGEVAVGGRTVALSNLGRPLFPAAGWAKRDLVAYYLAVADALVPHLRGRPLTLARLPDGVDGPGFFQNECRGRPPWMRAAALRLRTGAVRHYCLLEEPAALVWAANLAAVELHPYLVDAAAPDRPVALVLDLDPGPGVGIAACCRVALRLRELAAAGGLRLAVKTSGRGGLHLAAAVHEASFEETKGFARAAAARLRAESPALVTDDLARAARAGKVLVDWLQNAPRRSTVAPYSLRAAVHPRASAPVRWEEVEAVVAGGDDAALRFAPAAVVARLERFGDLFADALGPPARLPPAGGIDL